MFNYDHGSWYATGQGGELGNRLLDERRRTGDPISENRNGAANSPVYRQLMATTLAERNDGTPLEWPRTNLAYLTNSFMGSSTGRWASPLPGQVTTDGP